MGKRVPLDTQPLPTSGRMPPELDIPACGIGTLIQDLRPRGLIKRPRIVRPRRGLARALKFGLRALAAEGAVKSQHR